MYKKECVKGYEEYKVDTNGVVYGKKGNPLKFSTNPKGYNIVIFCINGKTKGFGVHQIVARQFVENDDKEHKIQVNHKDGNKANNHVENLEWVTPKENMQHSVNILGNLIEDKNHNAREIYGISITTHKVKYKFSSLIGAAKFFANNKNPRYIQNSICRALNNIDGRKTYRQCIWVYADELNNQYKIEDDINIIEDYVIERGSRKLSDLDIQWIRSNYIPYDKNFGIRGLARKFSVDHNTMWCIVNYKTYKDVM